MSHRPTPTRTRPRAGGEREDNIGQTTTDEEKNSKGNSIRFAIQVQWRNLFVVFFFFFLFPSSVLFFRMKTRGTIWWVHKSENCVARGWRARVCETKQADHNLLNDRRPAFMSHFSCSSLYPHYISLDSPLVPLSAGRLAKVPHNSSSMSSPNRKTLQGARTQNKNDLTTRKGGSLWTTVIIHT